MRKTVIILLCVLSAAVRAQGTGGLRILVDPGHNFEFIVDGITRLQQREVTLSEGPHRFTFYAPGRLLRDTTFNVVPDRTMDAVIHLPIAPAYVAYQQQLNTYRRTMRMHKLLPSLGTAAIGGYLLTRVIAYSSANKTLKDDAAAYNTELVPANITELKEVTIPEHQQDLDRAHTQVIVGSVAFGAAAIGTYFLFRKANRIPEPKYDDQEKVRFDGIAFYPRSSDGTWCMTINLRLP